MRNSTWWTIITVLLIIIVVLTWFLVVSPAEAPTTTIQPNATTTPSGGVTTPPALHDRVIVTSPKSGATVGKTFTVTGEAPGNWYFEASFPVQVYDKDHNKLAATPAQAQSDWMTTAQVPFTVTITLTGNYKGPATLVLLKDNPSGLPENEDSVEIPIVIQ